MPEFQLIQDPGFELSPAPAFSIFWFPIAPPGTTAEVVTNATEVPHTGTQSAFLISSYNDPVSLIQTVPVLIPPGATLHFSFFLRRDPGASKTDITADVTLLTPFPVPGFITISIPADSNPGTNKDEFEYYEAFSPPLIFPATGAIVAFTVAAGGEGNEVLLDDVFLTVDV